MKKWIEGLAMTVILALVVALPHPANAAVTLYELGISTPANTWVQLGTNGSGNIAAMDVSSAAVGDQWTFVDTNTSAGLSLSADGTLSAPRLFDLLITTGTNNLVGNGPFGEVTMPFGRPFKNGVFVQSNVARRVHIIINQ